ncbi:MAG: iron-sulfur cluster assembly accessory protein [Gammaproteobacteria bacterium]|nr:iron-sulfur cluster assembly accessory protein [Gammaproteobacteria bacterium]
MNDTVKINESTSPLQLTPAAVVHIKEYVAKHQHALGMRIDIKDAGCSGKRYEISAADKINDDDIVIEQQGSKVVVNRDNLLYCVGMEVDYITEGLNRKLVFNNPNADHLCGCGESFSLKK